MIRTIVSITGASGAGKSTLEKVLVEHFGGGRVRTITTRTPRAHETDRDYDFRSYWSLWFWQLLTYFWKTGYLWFVPTHGALYSVTEKEFTLAANETGGLAFVSITPERHEFLADHFTPQGVRCIAIHLAHPGEAVLRQRLEARGETEGAIRKRLADSVEFERNARKIANLAIIEADAPELVFINVLRLIEATP